ncbi:hypothetical protein IQ02_00884 [Flavobacterium glaciei]|uniref:Uncharacterized protein n=2 Tax=Flavobacterium glaciei TaxID=386300 RepID=A0A562PZH8_9FLAO|nr:hypothetical protein DFR66_103171 [Flavobacterium glaciei]TWI49486.1 hypothetical protein IQ02_00884 [Flavobacterium glaciei]
MEIKSNKFYFLIVFLFWIIDVFAGPGGSGPPVPLKKKPPPPPGLSIDENSIILVSIALLFGIYIVYVNMLKTKKPI